MRALVTAASRYGATAEIAGAIAEELARHDIDVVLMDPADVADVGEFDAVVLGSAVYSGHWLEQATELVARNRGRFAGRPVWLFSSGPTGDPSRKLVQQMGADPEDLPATIEATGAREHRMFAGRLDRGNLPPVQRFSLRLVRGLEGDFRDWAAIREWAAAIAGSLRQGA